MNAFVPSWLQTNPLSFVDAAKAGAEIGNAAHTAAMANSVAMQNIEMERERAAAELQMAKNNFLARMGYNQGRLAQGEERLGQGQQRIDQSGIRMGNLEDYRDAQTDARNRGLDIQDYNAHKTKPSPWDFLNQPGLPNTTGTGTNSVPDVGAAPDVTPDASAALIPGTVPGVGAGAIPNAFNNGSPFFSSGAESGAAAALATPMINGVPVDANGNPITSSRAPSIYGTFNPASGKIEPVQQ